MTKPFFSVPSRPVATAPFDGSALPLGSDARPNALGSDMRVLTLDGTVPAGFLMRGDRVITRSCGAQRLVAVNPVQLDGGLVLIRANTFGPQRPMRDVVLPANSEVLLRDAHALAAFDVPRALVPAHALCDGRRVVALRDQNARALRLVFDSPQILYAEGLELASAPPFRAGDCAEPRARPPANPLQ